MTPEVLLPQILERTALLASATSMFEFLPQLITPNLFQPTIEHLTNIPADRVLDNHYTVALIKPRLDQDLERRSIPDWQPTHLSHIDDSELAEIVECSIPHELTPVSKFAFLWSEPEIREFYSGALEKQTQYGATNPNRYPGHTLANRLSEFLTWMQQGPLTFLLLHSAQGQAVSTWRSAMGIGPSDRTWDVDHIIEHSPETIRGTFAKLGDGSHNNIVHGSDSPQSALRELDFFTALLINRQQALMP